MTKNTIWSSGIYALTSVAGTIERVGDGRDMQVTDQRQNGTFWPSIQLRTSDGQLMEIKNVLVSDYLGSYVSPGQTAEFFFRAMTYRNDRVVNFLVAAKTDEIALSDEGYLAKSAYTKSTLYYAVACVISALFILPTLGLAGVVVFFFLFKLGFNLLTFGLQKIPSHKDTWLKFKSLLRERGFTVA